MKAASLKPAVRTRARRRRRLAAGILVLFCFCRYNPTGTHRVEVDRNVAPEVRIDLGATGDTVTVWGSTTRLAFSLDASGGQIESLRATIQGGQIYFSSGPFEPSSEQSLWFDSMQYANGCYSFAIEARMRSGTGSLADKLGAEFAVTRRQWTLRVHNENPRPLSIVSVRPEDGRLRVDFEPCSAPNFQFYRITRHTEPYPGHRPMVYSDTIRDPLRNRFIDSVYVGGRTWYQVELTAGGLSVYGPEFFYEGPASRFTGYEQTPDRRIRLTWTRNPFFRNFRGYLIRKRTNLEEWIVRENIDDTTYADPESRFGTTTVYSLMDTPYGTDPFAGHGTPPDTLGPSLHAWLGEKMEPFTGAWYHRPTDRVFFMDGNAVFAWDPGTGTSLRPVYLPLDADPGGNPRYAFDIHPDGEFAYVSSGKTLFRMNPSDLTRLQTYDLGRSGPKFWDSIFRIRALADGTLALFSSDLALYDPIGKKTLGILFYPAGFGHPYSQYRFDGSDDLSHVTLQDVLFRRAGESLLEVEDLVPYQHRFHRAASGEQWLVESDFGRLDIRRLPGLERLYTFSEDSITQDAMIDPRTGRLGALSHRGEYGERELPSGAFVRRLPVCAACGRYFLLRDWLFSTNGFRIRMDEGG